MKILFKNITEYTKENCNNFKKFHINKYAEKEMFKYIVLAAVIIYILISNIMYGNWRLFLIILVSAIVIVLFYKLKPSLQYKIDKLLKNRPYDRYKYKPSEKKKEKPISKGNSLIPYKKKRISIFRNKASKEYIFYFYEGYMKIKHRMLTKKVWYYKFHKVFETDQYFFMYVDDKEPWMIEKDGFVIGDSKRFTEFIKGKCLFRYKKEQD